MWQIPSLQVYSLPCFRGFRTVSPLDYWIGWWLMECIDHCTVVKFVEGAKSTSQIVIDSQALLTNLTMWQYTYVHIYAAQAACCISPWVMTRTTYPLLCTQRGGNFSLREANQTSDCDYRGSASPPIFLWDRQSCWWAKSLSQSCVAVSEADGVFWALVWTKRWHRH